MSVSAVTPWLNCPELVATYEPSVTGAEVIIVDNASDAYTASNLSEMVKRLGGCYIRNETNNKFSPANNQGFAVSTGEIVVFLNNDISAPPELLAGVERDVKPGALYGPSLLHRMVDNRVLPYLEGFCIAATRDTWERVGLWPADLPGLYWDDNIVSLRALKAGVELIRTDWPVVHFTSYTTSRTPGATSASASNYDYFCREARAWN